MQPFWIVDEMMKWFWTDPKPTEMNVSGGSCGGGNIHNHTREHPRLLRYKHTRSILKVQPNIVQAEHM